jgi:hypothetical protein
LRSFGRDLSGSNSEITDTRTPRVVASDMNIAPIMNDRPNSRQADVREGLCETCRHQRVVTSDRGSRFIFCDKSRTDPRFPRYPRLPVLSCEGYAPRPS